MNQEDLVLGYLKKYGNITPDIAWVKLGVYRLAAVVYKLRKKGAKITCVKELGVNQFGEETRYGRYFLGV